MSRDGFFDSNADFVSPKPQPPAHQPYSPYATSYHQQQQQPLYQQQQYQQPQYAPSASYSSPSTYLNNRPLPTTPSYPTSAPAAYYTAPPSPNLSQRPSLADRYTPVGSTPTLLSRNASDSSVKEKKPSSSCCGFRRRTLCGCCLCFVFLIVAAIAAIFLLAKAPEIAFQSVEPPSNGLPAFAVDGPNFTMNFNLKIGIKNRNLIGVTVSKVAGEAKFPVSDSVIGTGKLENLSIPKQSDQTVLFPFQIAYDPIIDPESKILLYVAKQCGLLGGTKGKLEVNYTIKLSFGFLATFGIVPSFTNKASFDCPLSGSQLPAGIGALAKPSSTTKRRRSLRSPIDIEISPSDWIRIAAYESLRN